MKHRATTWPELRFVTCPKSEDWWRFFKVPLHQVRPKKHGRKPPSTQWPLYFLPLVNFSALQHVVCLLLRLESRHTKRKPSVEELTSSRRGGNDNPWDPPTQISTTGSELHQTYTFLDPASSICHSAEANRLIPCMTMGWQQATRNQTKLKQDSTSWSKMFWPGHMPFAHQLWLHIIVLHHEINKK